MSSEKYLISIHNQKRFLRRKRNNNERNSTRILTMKTSYITIFKFRFTQNEKVLMELFRLR